MGAPQTPPPWKTTTLPGYSAGQALTLFYAYNDGNVTISTMLGNDMSTLTPLASLNGVSGLTRLILGEHSSLTLQGLTADTVIVDITGTVNYTLSRTKIPAPLDNIKFLNNGALYNAAMSTDPQANSTMIFAPVPEPGSAALGAAGLAVLLWRRRRTMSH